jgi:hypothetical protein
LELTEEQTKQMIELLDEWMPNNEEIEGNITKYITMTTMWLNDITMIRAVKNPHANKYGGYYLYRCFWMFDHPEISVDVENLGADALLAKLFSILISIGEMKHV